MRIVAAAILLFATSMGPTAHSAPAFWDGSKLIDLAAADDRLQAGTHQHPDPQKAAMLMGYVVGVADALEGKETCIPKNVKISQLIAIVKKSVRDRPERWNESGDVLVAAALGATFPCSRSR